jgi:hypothetical protein
VRAVPIVVPSAIRPPTSGAVVATVDDYGEDFFLMEKTFQLRQPDRVAIAEQFVFARLLLLHVCGSIESYFHCDVLAGHFTRLKKSVLLINLKIMQNSSLK